MSYFLFIFPLFSLSFPPIAFHLLSYRAFTFIFLAFFFPCLFSFMSLNFPFLSFAFHFLSFCLCFADLGGLQIPSRALSTTASKSQFSALASKSGSASCYSLILVRLFLAFGSQRFGQEKIFDDFSCFPDLF